MNVRPEMADETVFVCIDPLNLDWKDRELANWIDQVNTLAFSYMRVSAYTTDQFWSTVLFNSNFLYSFDAVLEALPRGHSLDRFQLVYRSHGAAIRAVENLRTHIYLIYCRIHCFPSSADKSLSQQQWQDYMQRRKLMTFQRAAHVWAIYPAKLMLFATFMKKISRSMNCSERIVRDLAGDLQATFKHYETAFPHLLQKFNLSQGVQQVQAAGLIRKSLYHVADAIFTAQTTLDVLQRAGILEEPYHFVARLPHLLDVIGRSLPVGVLMDVAAVLHGWPMRSVLQINTLIQQGAVRLFSRVLELLPAPTERFKILEGVLQHQWFLYLISEFSGLAGLLSPLSPEERAKVEAAVAKAFQAQQSTVSRRVENEGLLEELGNVDRLKPHQQQALRELHDVFQNMSIPYLHLCLRHFNYDSAYAIESMLSVDHAMPRDLRRMEQTARPTKAFPPSLPTVSYRNIDMIEKAVKQQQQQPRNKSSAKSPAPPAAEQKKNPFKGLFSLAPAETTQPTTGAAAYSTSSLDDKVERKPSLHEIIDDLRGQLDRCKLRAAGAGGTTNETEAVQEGPNGERLIPMHEARRYAGISKIVTSEADRVAVRPTYEQYKYETRFEEDENVYEDEYDDGYEQREFQVEPLNERLSSSEESESEEGVDKPDSSSAAAARGGGGARGRGRGRGGGGTPPPPAPGAQDAAAGQARKDGYTGGRQRQMKERHKNEWKQRGADRKRRGGLF